MNDFDKYMFYLKKQCDKLMELGERYIKLYGKREEEEYTMQRGVLYGYMQCLYDNDFISYDEWNIMSEYVKDVTTKALDVEV